MKKRVFSIILALLVIASCFSGCQQKNEEIAEQPERQIKNIIFLIPDGGGYGNYDLANDVKVAGGFL